MPPLDEGALLFMPTTLPGIAVAEAQQLLQVTGRTLKRFPEVDRVLGKSGRAETATDPAPFSMMETIVTLRPQSTVAQGARPGIRTGRRLDEAGDCVAHHQRPHLHRSTGGRDGRALTMPGVANAWTMPIKNASTC